jgi:hypothetical protein
MLQDRSIGDGLNNFQNHSLASRVNSHNDGSLLGFPGAFAGPFRVCAISVVLGSSVNSIVSFAYVIVNPR